MTIKCLCWQCCNNIAQFFASALVLQYHSKFVRQISHSVNLINVPANKTGIKGAKIKSSCLHVRGVGVEADAYVLHSLFLPN